MIVLLHLEFPRSPQKALKLKSLLDLLNTKQCFLCFLKSCRACLAHIKRFMSIFAEYSRNFTGSCVHNFPEIYFNYLTSIAFVKFIGIDFPSNLSRFPILHSRFGYNIFSISWLVHFNIDTLNVNCKPWKKEICLSSVVLNCLSFLHSFTLENDSFYQWRCHRTLRLQLLFYSKSLYKKSFD